MNPAARIYIGGGWLDSSVEVSSMLKKIIAILSLAIIVIIGTESIILYNHRSVPVIQSSSFEIVSVEKRTDDVGNNIQISVTNAQRDKIAECLINSTKKMTLYTSRGFSGTDYDILIKFVDYEPDMRSYYMLIGKKNMIQSEKGSRVYRINEPDLLKERILNILDS